jgi:hypothetical protein
LAELYNPSDEEFNVETISLVFADFQEDIVADYGQEITVEELPNFLDTLTIQQGRGLNGFFGLFGKKYTPRGWVHIENTEKQNTHEPLKRCRIRTGRSFWWRDTYTDNNGFFRATKRYRGKVRVRAKWRSYEATIRKTFGEMLGFWVSDHLMTLTRGNNERTRHIYEGQDHLWFKGTVHNGIIRYNDFAFNRNIDKRVSNANVWVWENGNGNASTPMLYHYRQLPTIASIAGSTQLNVWGSMVSFMIGLTPRHLRPDMIFTGLENMKVGGLDNTARIHQKVFHESAHFSHARKAGSWFWANLFAAEIGNEISHGDPYYDGTEPNLSEGRRIALVEGWGTFLEFKISEYYYGKTWVGYFASNPSSYMDSFDMYTVPMTQPNDDNDHWFMTGLFWDLNDSGSEINNKLRNGQTGLPIGEITDNLSTDIDFIFNFMKYNVRSGYDLKLQLMNYFSQNPYASSLINTIFSSYGF